MASAGNENVEGISSFPRPKEWIQQRYIVAAMGAICIMMQYILKVNLSVGIVAMVKPLRTPGSNDTDTASSEDEGGEFSWSMELQGHILAAYYYGYVATQFFGGYAANRWGGKVVVGPGIALTGFFTVFSPIAARRGGPWSLFVVRVLEGMCSGVILPGMHHMFSVWFPPCERSAFSGMIFSSLYFGTVIGMAASGPLSLWPLEGGGWPMIFYFFGVLGVLIIIPWWILIFDSPATHPHISEGEKNFILKEMGKEEKHFDTKREVPWFHLLTDIHLWTGITFHWGTAWVLYTMLSDLPTYMKNVLYFDIQELSFLSALPSLLTWISSIISGILSQWLRKKNYVSHIAAYKIFNGIAALGPTVCLIVITQVQSDPQIIVALLALNGLAAGAFFGGSYVNHIDLAVNFAGITSGILHTVLNSSGIVTPLVIAAIVGGEQTMERWAIVFYLGAGISAGTYLLYLVFGSVRERPWNNMNDENGRRIQVRTIFNHLKCE